MTGVPGTFSGGEARRRYRAPLTSSTTLFGRAAASFEDGRASQARASRGVPGSGMCGTRYIAGMAYRHIPYPARPEEGRPSQWRTRRPVEATHRRLGNSASTGRAVSDDLGVNARPAVKGGQSEDRQRGHSRGARSEKVAIRVVSRREYEAIVRCCRSFASTTRQAVAKVGIGARSLNTGLLGRPWRPSVARTASSLGWLIGSLRPRCSGERRPPSKTEEPGRGALPVECPVAECVERATPPGRCTGTFRTRHVPRWRAFLSGVRGCRWRRSNEVGRTANIVMPGTDGVDTGTWCSRRQRGRAGYELAVSAMRGFADLTTPGRRVPQRCRLPRVQVHKSANTCLYVHALLGICHNSGIA